MIDKRHRGIEYLRISVTDRCNLRCVYCMPEEGVSCLTHDEILTFEEIVTICKSAAELGISKIKLTGGEPLVRKDFTELVRKIKAIPGIEEITLTTNGLLLERQLELLIEAGISKINISLDTLDRARFKEITRVDGLDTVVRAINSAAIHPEVQVKVNSLIAKNLNENEILGLAALAKNEPISVRFIEVMPIGLGRDLQTISKNEMIEILERHYGKLIPYEGKLGNGPAKYYEIPGFEGKIGFISAVSECFCEACNRVRLTANGYLKLCLHSTKGLDLKKLLREGMSQEELTKVMAEAIVSKPEKHHFGEASGSHIENKIMSQIGG